jgi:hypothetical protein
MSMSYVLAKSFHKNPICLMSFVKKIKFGGKKNSSQNISLSLNEKYQFTSSIEMCRAKNLFVFFDNLKYFFIYRNILFPR